MTPLLATVCAELLFSLLQGDPLRQAAEEASERLKAEERRFELGASTKADLRTRRRELLRAERAMAIRDGAPSAVERLFDQEIRVAEEEVQETEQKVSLGASDANALTARRLDLLAVRKNLLRWKLPTLEEGSRARKAAVLQLESALKEQMALAAEQLQNEQRMLSLGATGSDSVARRRAYVDSLRAELQAFRPQ